MMYVDNKVIWCLDCDLEVVPSPENIYGYGIVECPRCGYRISARKITKLSPGGTGQRQFFWLLGEELLRAPKRTCLMFVGMLQRSLRVWRDFEWKSVNQPTGRRWH